VELKFIFVYISGGFIHFPKLHHSGIEITDGEYGSLTGKVPKLHHSGIEMYFEKVGGLVGKAQNCTIVELK